jgi:hypothetical protein
MQIVSRSHIIHKLMTITSETIVLILDKKSCLNLKVSSLKVLHMVFHELSAYENIFKKNTRKKCQYIVSPFPWVFAVKNAPSELQKIKILLYCMVHVVPYKSCCMVNSYFFPRIISRDEIPWVDIRGGHYR